MAKPMKSKMLLFSILFSLISCSNKNEFDNIVAAQYQQCKEKNCVIYFSDLMWFEWDTMCFYSSSNSLEQINEDLGFKLYEFTDMGDRVIFLNKGKFVYQKEWFKEPSQPLKGTVFVTDLKKFKLSKFETNFIIKKHGEALYLEKFE
jgi:hypothetical protein